MSITTVSDIQLENRITAVEAEINPLTDSVNRDNDLYENDNLGDDEFQKWIIDVGRLNALEIDLRKLNEERDRRLHG
ncbi:unnamed protein product [Rotaria magnacalcarata]|uniref:Uncharacterized protein n=2 Tax=Rotaria magnacalcarata TaxID=392030 RepID=A0A820FQC7_9BILA|nr:unnamed protein product [Rotaria magnacalcarata]CAF4265313.1 unnamed protein product [Rotaria magnacalcarata]